jgi:hypothetical protein
VALSVSFQKSEKDMPKAIDTKIDQGSCQDWNKRKSGQGSQAGAAKGDAKELSLVCPAARVVKALGEDARNLETARLNVLHLLPCSFADWSPLGSAPALDEAQKKGTSKRELILRILVAPVLSNRRQATICTNM